MRFKWVRHPITEPLTLATVYEHTPLNPHKGEYPRFLRPVGCRQPQWQWMKLYEDGTLLHPGEQR